MKRKYIFLFWLFVLCICACEKTDESRDNTDLEIRENESGYEKIVFDEPDEFYSKHTMNCILGDNGETPCYFFLINEGENTIIKYYLFDLEEGWKEASLSWLDDFELHEGEKLKSLFMDSSKNFYAYVSSDQKIGKLYCYPENGEKRSLNIGKAFEVYPELDFFTVHITYDDKLAFFFRDDDNPEWNDAMDDVVIYDPITETVVNKNEKIDPLLSVFGPENSVYYVSAAQKGIMGKNLDENIPGRFIACQGVTDDGSARISIRDEKGYICSSEGIYGGSFDDKEWEMIFPAEIYKDIDGKDWRVSGFMKVPGDDKEFLINVYNMEESKWVYCY